MKVHVGDPAAARAYVEADRGRADDYYLTEGTGFARRFTATDGPAIRERRVTDGRVNQRVAITGSGQRIGARDRIATRRNDRNLGVANRDTWTVTAVGRNGELVVTPAGPVTGDVPGGVTPDPQGARVLPPDYLTAHVQLA